MKIQSLRDKWILLFFAFFSVSISKGMMVKSTMSHLRNLVEGDQI